jgi:hypothetical protein
MSDSIEAMVARIDERTLRMENDICNKCKQIDGHEKRLGRLESHDYAEMILVGAVVLVTGWAIAAGFVRA